MVIGAFPDPYPGELLYSIQARYQERLGDWRARPTPTELFGSSSVVASTLFSSHLSTLVARLPEGALNACVPEQEQEQEQKPERTGAHALLVEHTLWPYYAPFLPPARLAEAREDLLGAGGPWAQARMGIKASAVPAPRWLRYCPLCVQEDRATVGEPYWRRDHQAPGALICARHVVWLENSDIRARGQRSRHLFVPARQALRVVAAPRPLRRSPERDALLTLSRATCTLLTSPLIWRARPLGLEGLRAVYLRTLVAQGFASSRGRIRMCALTEAFLATYPDSLLRLLHCQLTGELAQHTHWLARLTRKPRRAQHPLHHLLLLEFLELGVGDVFDAATAPSEGSSEGPGEAPAIMTRLLPMGREAPFGAGPWPCLNPVCGRYHTDAVTMCDVTYPNSARGRPCGTFACACGFTYKRLGPDATPADRMRRGAVVAYGALWERALRQRWNNAALSVNALARQLGVDPLTIKRQAQRLRLPLTRPCAGRAGRAERAGRVRHLRLQAPLKGRKVYRLAPQECQRRRATWRALLKAHPDMPTRQLRRLDQGVYTWLYRHDATWLRAHVPRGVDRPPRDKARVNWPHRDRALARTIDRIAADLRAAHDPARGKPIRVTVTLIGRRLGQLALLQQHLDRLPETAGRLAALCESWEEFAARRVWWAATTFRQARHPPKPWELIRRAGVARHMTNPVIALEVRQALEWFSQTAQEPVSEAEAMDGST